MIDSLLPSGNSSVDESTFIKQETVQIKVENFESNTLHWWSVKKFYDKLDMIKDMIGSY